MLLPNGLTRVTLLSLAGLASFLSSCAADLDDASHLDDTQSALSAIDWGTVAQRFAPHVYLHPLDKHRPTSVESFLRNSELRDQSGLIRSDVSPDDLVDAPADSYLAIANNEPIAGDQVVDGQVRAPMYVYVRPDVSGDFVDLSYIFLYGYNGCQVFRIGLHNILHFTKRTFTWCGFARHEGDWEHITVRLSSDTSHVKAVFFARHAQKQGEWRDASGVSFDGTHPIVYSALNSHGSYATSDTFTLEEIKQVRVWTAFIGPIRWLNVADTTTTEDVVVPDQDQRDTRSIEWIPWEISNGLVMLRDQTWLRFRGSWGAPTDNSHIERPAPLPYGAADYLLVLGRLAQSFDFLPSQYTSGGGPCGPVCKQYWNAGD